METTCNVPTPVDVPARLSHAQKRELLVQAVAAVITTALIAAPLITPPAGGAHVSSETALPAYSFAGVVHAVAVADVDTRIIRVTPPARARARTRVRTEIQGIANATNERSEPRKALGRKLTGWLTGDGTIAVRPFPTVFDERQ